VRVYSRDVLQLCVMVTLYSMCFIHYTSRL